MCQSSKRKKETPATCLYHTAYLWNLRVGHSLTLKKAFGVVHSCSDVAMWGFTTVFTSVGFSGPVVEEGILKTKPSPNPAACNQM